MPLMIKILCTRTISNELIQQAASKNIMIDVKDFITVKPRMQEKDIPFIQHLISRKEAAVIFTSKHAVHTLAEFISGENVHKGFPQWNIYTISHITLKSVSLLFPHSVIQGDAGNAGGLAKRIIEDKTVREVNFFCGNIRRDTIPDTLKRHGIRVNEFIIYETIPVPHFIIEAYDGYVFFSPSAVESFFSANEIQKQKTCFAIGETTASAVKDKADNKIIIAKEQDAANMIASVINFYQ
jgi:uroporphyrinogen-III synthase